MHRYTDFIRQFFFLYALYQKTVQSIETIELLLSLLITCFAFYLISALPNANLTFIIVTMFRIYYLFDLVYLLIKDEELIHRPTISTAYISILTSILCLICYYISSADYSFKEGFKTRIGISILTYFTYVKIPMSKLNQSFLCSMLAIMSFKYYQRLQWCLYFLGSLILVYFLTIDLILNSKQVCYGSDLTTVYSIINVALTIGYNFASAS